MKLLLNLWLLPLAIIMHLNQTSNAQQGLPCQGISDTCEFLLNGDLEQHDLPENGLCHFELGGTLECDLADICNWKGKVSTPVYCSGENKAPSLVLGTWFEAVVTREEMDLQVGEDYILSFEYCRSAEPQAYIPNGNRTLAFGLTDSDIHSSVGFLGNVDLIGFMSFLPDVDFNFDYPACFGRSEVLRKREFYFSPTSSKKKLYFQASGAPNSSFGDFIHLRNIQVRKCEMPDCVPEPSFIDSLNNCEVCFYGSNSGDSGTYFWDFGDGDTETGQNVCHEYLRGGKYQVCLTIKCANGEGLQTCEVVEIPQSCTSCDTLQVESIEAIKCDETDGLAPYRAKIKLQLPLNNMDICPESNLKILSDDAVINLSSPAEIERGGAGMPDFLRGDIEITPFSPPLAVCGSSDDPIIASFIICSEDSTQYCYSFPICAKDECDNCLGSLDAVANCDNSQSSPTVFVYTGSKTFNTVTEFGQITTGFCGLNNFPSPDFQGSVSPGVANEWTFDYQIMTTDPDFVGTTATICLSNAGVEYCFEVFISIGTPCPSGPPTCSAVWSPKKMECTNVRTNGDIVFNISTTIPLISGDQVCSTGLAGSISNPGTLEINSSSVNGSILTYDINIVMPPTYDQTDLYYLEFDLCDENGNPICYLLPLWLECDPTQGNSAENDLDKYISSDQLRIAPNPSRRQIRLLHNEIENGMYKIIFTDISGKRIEKKEKGGNGRIKTDVNELLSGIYMVELRNDANNQLLGVEKLVVYK